MKGRELGDGRRKLARTEPHPGEEDDDEARRRVDDEAIYMIGKESVPSATQCLLRPEVQAQCGNGLLLALFLRSIDANMWLHYIQTQVFTFADMVRLCLTSTWLRRMVPLCVDWERALTAQAGATSETVVQSTQRLLALMQRCTEKCPGDRLQARRAHFMVMWEACRGGDYCGRCIRRFPSGLGAHSRWFRNHPTINMPVPTSWLKRHGAAVFYCLGCFSDTHEPTPGCRKSVCDWNGPGPGVKVDFTYANGVVPLTTHYFGLRRLHRMKLPRNALDFMHATREEAAAHDQLGTPRWPVPPESLTGSDEHGKCYYWLPDAAEYTRKVMAYIYQELMGVDRHQAIEMAHMVSLDALNNAITLTTAKRNLMYHGSVAWLILNSEEEAGSGIEELPGAGWSKILNRV